MAAGGTKVKAVIFDMGGVILPSPFPLLNKYEEDFNMPKNSIIKQIVKYGNDGAWPKLERDELTYEEFLKKMTEEATEMHGKPTDMSAILQYFKSAISTAEPLPQMMEVIEWIRSLGIKVALLTNNWYNDERQCSIMKEIDAFDLVIQSCVEKMRKPEKRIFQLTLDRLGVKGEEAVFLDDIESNAKGAEVLGIRTIHVTDREKAAAELKELIKAQQ